MARWIAVHGEDVFVERKPGWNVDLEVVAGFERAAEARANAAVLSRFPSAVLNTKVVDTRRVRDSRIPGADVYLVTVFVPVEGVRSAGIGHPLNALLELVNHRIRDPITGKIRDLSGDLRD